MGFHTRQATDSDWTGIRDVLLAAFGDEGPVIVDLTADLLAAGDAAPLLSLVAVEGEAIAGHVLFTSVQVEPSGPPAPSSILAPLSVHPRCQGKGVGGQLVTGGISRLKASGVGLVFVLGHPEYYPRHGFSPAGVQGLDAPYPIPPENAGAWMVQELRPGTIDGISGRVTCARPLHDPKHWRE
jgi:predicted N-acetyltransferase YhbS